MKILTVAALMSLTGCATMQDHPYLTGFGVAVIAGSIAASQQHDNRVSPLHANTQPVNCAGGACQ